MATRLPKVSIIGAGTVGSTLALALSDKGYPIVSIISRTGRNAIALAKAVKCKRASTTLGDLAANSEIIFITVSDSSIEETAVQLSRIKPFSFRNVFVAHCSGAHSSSILEPVRKKGSRVASIHPIQTFPSGLRPERLKAKLKGIFYGIDCSPDSLKIAQQIVQILGGTPLVIQEELKPLYHLACVFASNYMMVFLNTISEISSMLDLHTPWTEVFGPLMTTTMENVVKGSAASMLTGPIVRGDFSTVDLHLKTLSRYAPQFLPLYTVGGIEVARLAKNHGRLSQEEFEEIISRFRKYIKSPSTKTISKVKH